MTFWKITKKDLRLLARDKRTLFGLVALPLFFITILGISAGQLFTAKEKAKRIRVGVVNEDTSTLSTNLIGEVLKLDALELVEMADRSEGKERLADGKVDVVAFIGPRFHEKVDELDTADIIFAETGKLSAGLRSLDVEVQSGAFLASAAQVVEQLVFAFALRAIAPEVMRANDPKLALKLFVKAKRSAHDREESEAPAAGPVITKSRSDVIYEYLVPSYTVMFVFFVVNLMARSLLGERETGTLTRLLIGPVTRTGMMVGKTIPFFVISLAQTLLLLVAGKFLFHMSWGESPWMLVPVIVSTSLAATALGLLVATAVRTDSQVTAYSTFLVLIMAGMSGCLMPRSWQPELMQQLGLVTPQAWALIAYEHLLGRDVPNLHVVWNACATLVAFAVAFFAVAGWRFRALE
jgi:ABC-type multidrug transport system permease subunit